MPTFKCSFIFEIASKYCPFVIFGESKLHKVFGDFDKDLDVKISTDTRTIQKGDFYLPLKGASFDGEKFIEQALEKGAVGAFCTLPCSLSKGEGWGGGVVNPSTF